VKHYDVTEWLDFVHGLVGEPKRGEMEAHLGAACNRCEATVGQLRKLIQAAVAEARYSVPEPVVHMARALYSLQRPEQVEVLPRLLAHLVFDSFREPALAGVRGQQRITRQAMYEAGDYCVDLRMEQERGAATVALVGQIVNRAAPDQKVADIPVLLMTGAEVLGRARSNEFGEFQLEYEPRQPLSLHVPVERAGKEIEVRLQDLFGKQ
jgi:anti-sigma factor RsiW